MYSPVVSGAVWLFSFLSDIVLPVVTQDVFPVDIKHV